MSPFSWFWLGLVIGPFFWLFVVAVAAFLFGTVTINGHDFTWRPRR